MKLTPSLRRGVLAGAILTITAASSQAALIVWGAPTDITGDSDVSTAGTLVSAMKITLQPVVPLTVNGVAFDETPLSFGSMTSGNLAFTGALFGVNSNETGLSASYNALLSGYAGGAPMTLTMSGLAIGGSYQVQFWTDSGVNETMTVSAGNSVVLNALGGGHGQFAIGTFTAGASNELITFSSTSTGTGVNAVQLRQLAPAPAVPEPGTALAGVALLGLCGMRRRRR